MGMSLRTCCGPSFADGGAAFAYSTPTPTRPVPTIVSFTHGIRR